MTHLEECTPSPDVSTQRITLVSAARFCTFYPWLSSLYVSICSMISFPNRRNAAFLSALIPTSGTRVFTRALCYAQRRRRSTTWSTGALGKHQLLLALLRLRQQHITHRCCVLFSFSYKSFAVHAFILQCAFKPTETCKSAVAFIGLCCSVWLGVPVRKMLSQVPQSSNMWRSLLIPDVTTTAA